MNALTHIRKVLFGVKTQAEFAEIIGVNQSTVSRWEKGARPSFDQIKDIQRVAANRGIECPDRLFEKRGVAA